MNFPPNDYYALIICAQMATEASAPFTLTVGNYFQVMAKFKEIL